MWYAIQVVGGRENTVLAEIKRTVDPECYKEVFSPRYETQKKVRSEWIGTTAPLLPGYLIVDTRQIDAFSTQLRKVKALTKVLGSNEAFIPLTRPEMEWLNAFTDNPHRTVTMSTAVREGDRIVITSGPLMRHEGLIKSINRRKSLAFLEIQMFGRTITTKVGLAILRKQG
ncbi:MAG: antiterminator LoaP [Eggerthellaceae bacterium]